MSCQRDYDDWVKVEYLADECITCGERYKGDCHGEIRAIFDARQKEAWDEFHDYLCEGYDAADKICTKTGCADCDVRYHCRHNSELRKGDMEEMNGYTASIVGTAKHMVLAYRKAMERKETEKGAS